MDEAGTLWVVSPMLEDTESLIRLRSETAVACAGAGITVPIRHLVIAKVLAGRPKDIDDASALWRRHGRTMDAGRVRDTLRLLEEALAQSDLVSTFERISR